MENNLITGDRYTFCKKNLDISCNSIFRANFIQIYTHKNGEKSVYVTSIDTEFSKKTKFMFPLSLLLEVNNLERILKNKSNIPNEILRVIDSYL
jgi:hypothetical protein